MKKTAFLVAVFTFVLSASIVMAAKPTEFDANGVEKGWEKTTCTTIQDGTLYGSDGSLLTTGYNQWGYNYQAHMFNGMWCDYHPLYRPGGADYEWCQENMADVELMMKWSDTWLANTSCNGDDLLDRGYSCYPDDPTNSGCPGAWLTNHERGSYPGEGEETCNYECFVKIVTPSDPAYVDGGIWYTADGTEIGAQIWGAFAITQEIYNDSCGEHGLLYKSPTSPGLGYYTPKPE